MFNPTLLTQIDALKAREDRSAYIDAIAAWQSGGDNSALKETIAKCIESSLIEILSLAGEEV